MQCQVRRHGEERNDEAISLVRRYLREIVSLRFYALQDTQWTGRVRCGS